MKKSTKLTIKKVTLRDLDESALDAVAGGAISFPIMCPPTADGCPPTFGCPRTSIHTICGNCG